MKRCLDAKLNCYRTRLPLSNVQRMCFIGDTVNQEVLFPTQIFPRHAQSNNLAGQEEWKMGYGHFG